MKTIVNGAPGVVDLGVQDLSIRPYSRAPEELPQHLPKYFIFAQKGPTSEELLAGVERINMYGEDTFVERSKYFNHQTMHSNGVTSPSESGTSTPSVVTAAGSWMMTEIWTMFRKRTTPKRCGTSRRKAVNATVRQHYTSRTINS